MAVAKVSDVQHAFWIVLGTLSVLRTSATATGSTALRGLAGTIAGFAVGAALLVGIGTSPTALWIAFPLAVLVAAYTPGTAPFVVGQAAFTVTIVVLFNLLVPAGWRVGLLRVEDVAIGCAVSLVVGFLFWPRGVSSVVGDNLADAFRSGASYLGDATRWALGEREHRPERAAAAIATGNRLDDAVRGYLTEQGSKRLSKADLWALVMAAMRLRLTAHSMASLPTRIEPHPDDHGLHAALGRQVADLGSFYDGLAAKVARPGRAGPSRGADGGPAAGQPDQRRRAVAVRACGRVPVRRAVGRPSPRSPGGARGRPHRAGGPAGQPAAPPLVAVAACLALRAALRLRDRSVLRRDDAAGGCRRGRRAARWSSSSGRRCGTGLPTIR